MSGQNSNSLMDERFRQLLEGAEVSPSARVWESVEEAITQERRRRPVFWWIFPSILFTVLLGISASVWFYFYLVRNHSTTPKSYEITSTKRVYHDHRHSKNELKKSAQSLHTVNLAIISGDSKSKRANGFGKMAQGEPKYKFTDKDQTLSSRKLEEIESLKVRNAELESLAESPSLVINTTNTEKFIFQKKTISGMYIDLGFSFGSMYYLNSRKYVDPVLGEGANHYNAYNIRAFLGGGYRFKNKVHLEGLIEYSVSKSKFANVNYELNYKGTVKNTQYVVSVLSGKSWDLPSRKSDRLPQFYFSAGPSYTYLNSSRVVLDQQATITSFRVINSFDGISYYPRHYIGLNTRVGFVFPVKSRVELQTGMQGSLVADAQSMPTWFEKSNIPANEGSVSVFFGIKLRGKK